MKAAQKKTDQKDAAILAQGEIGDTKVVVFILDFNFMGGSMGQFVGEAFKIGCQNAVDLNCPFISVASSGGARMQEGILSLMQMPRTTVMLQSLRESKLPYIVLLTNPTTGGVTASYAMLGDIHIAEPKALIGFAGPRVIGNTINESLPEGFQKSEYLLDHGMIDMVVHRKDLKSTISNIIDYKMSLKDAIESSKIHHQWFPDEIKYEKSKIPIKVLNELELLGHNLIEVESLGNLMGIKFDEKSLKYNGYSDSASADGEAKGY